MVMRPDVLAASLDAGIPQNDPRPRFMMSPRGRPLTATEVLNHYNAGGRAALTSQLALRLGMSETDSLRFDGTISSAGRMDLSLESTFGLAPGVAAWLILAKDPAIHALPGWTAIPEQLRIPVA